MTPEQFAEALRAHEAQQEAERAATKAATTPHVRKPQDRSTVGRYSSTNPLTDLEAFRGEGGKTFCGAQTTSYDWDRRAATAKKNRAEVASAGVCPECLELAR